MLIGQEYTVIGWCKNRLILQDKIMLQSLLEDVCVCSGMKSLGSIGVDVPLELRKLKQERFEDEGGSTSCVLSGHAEANQACLILSTSHANIHGWPYRDSDREDGGFFWFTIGSCRGFDTDKIDKVLTKFLKMTEVNRAHSWIQCDKGVITRSSERPEL